jgi:hypothetical protein
MNALLLDPALLDLIGNMAERLLVLTQRGKARRARGVG